jgi:hypothetical protein
MADIVPEGGALKRAKFLWTEIGNFGTHRRPPAQGDEEAALRHESSRFHYINV